MNTEPFPSNMTLFRCFLSCGTIRANSALPLQGFLLHICLATNAQPPKT